MKQRESQREKHREHRSRKHWLTQSVQSHVVPELMRMGFALAPAEKLVPPVDRDYSWSFPQWGRFMRVRGSVVDVLEIQFASRGRAAFRINAGVSPKEGVTTWAGHKVPEEMAVHWLEEYFETHARPWLRPMLRALGIEPIGAWFSATGWPYQSIGQTDYDKLAHHVVGLLQEIDIALREGRTGPHIRRVVIPWASRPRPRNTQ